MRSGLTILTHGLTTVVIRPRRVAIYHAGNMGLLSVGTAEGSADYSWKLTLSRKDFNAVVA